jgi:hypothetical protein
MLIGMNLQLQNLYVIAATPLVISRMFGHTRPRMPKEMPRSLRID